MEQAVLAEVYKGAPYRLFGFYVASPLTWGIHAKSGCAMVWDEAKETTVAVSRFGSGSHLMALVDARLRSKPPPARFEVVGDLNGARAALRADPRSVFFWEKFTTKPLVDAAEWDRIAECPTPWPCFAVAASNAALDRLGGDAIADALAVVKDQAKTLKADPKMAVDEIAREYNLEPQDVAEWFGAVEWSATAHAPKATLDEVAASLVDAKVLDQAQVDERSYADLVSSFTVDKPL